MRELACQEFFCQALLPWRQAGVFFSQPMTVVAIRFRDPCTYCRYHLLGIERRAAVGVTKYW